MAAVSPTTFSSAFIMNEKSCILIRMSLNFVPKGPIGNNPALVWIMAWCLKQNGCNLVVDTNEFS